MSILEHFPYETFRDGQEGILKAIEKAWHRTDVIVLLLPTAFGKTVTAKTIVDWRHSKGDKASIICPNNELVRQGRREFPDLLTVRRAASYGDRAQYEIAKREAKFNPSICNYYSYLGNRLYADTLVVDEAHMLVDFLREKEQITMWQHTAHYPDGLTTVGDLLNWLDGLPSPTKLQQRFKEKLANAENSHIIERRVEEWRGEPKECIRLVPLTPRHNKEIMWPKCVKKVVLMSATIGKEDLYDLGLDRKRYVIIEAGSPIDPARRPITYWPLGNMSYGNADLEAVAEWTRKMMEARPHEKGLLHAPYSTAWKLKKHMDNDRLLFHTRHNKDDVLDLWLNSHPSEGLVLVGSGLNEGIDLKHDLGRWQAIVKVPFANLRDRAVAARLADRPQSYAWDAAKSVVQAAGRICRDPEDWGDTFILDSNFKRLYEDNREMFPHYYKEALNGI